MSIPFSIGKIIDTATSADPSQRILGLTLSQFYGGLAGIFVLGSVCNFGRVLLLRIVGERVVARTRARLFQKTLAQDGEFFDANRHGDIISRLSSDTTIVGKAITQNVSDGLRAVVQAGAAFGMMGYVSLQLTGIMTFIVPPIAIAAIFYGRYVRDLSKKTQKALGDLTKVSEERLGNVRTAQSFSGEVMEVRRYNERIREIFQLAKREATASGLFFSSNGLAGNATVLAVLGIGGRMVADGTITVGELSSFMLYTAYAGFSMVGLSSFYSELMKGVGAASRLFELLDRKPSIKTTTGLKLDHLKGHIQFKDVKFAYPTRPAVTIFNRLSFEILPGRNYAIVGPSGGGKSTISALIQRFYDPLDGQILIDEHDIRTLNLKHLRRQLSLVSQEPVLFSGTIAENISYGKPGASFNEIVEAARKANCRFIADFPDGFETKVGPRGTQLSGGQKQRIAIARALIRNPAVLIMDEATSALDARSESLVNEALQNIMAGDLTTITIAHRLATIRRADSIIVLSPNGDVAEQGTFDELIAKDGAFARLMEFQLDDGVGQFKRQDSV
ncbi:ATP-binding cassette permease mdl1 [Saitoella coloradoensis]